MGRYRPSSGKGKSWSAGNWAVFYVIVIIVLGSLSWWTFDYTPLQENSGVVAFVIVVICTVAGSIHSGSKIKPRKSTRSHIRMSQAKSGNR